MGLYESVQSSYWMPVSTQWKISNVSVGNVPKCPGSNLTHDIDKAILNIQAISYYRWDTINKHVKKAPIQWIFEKFQLVIFSICDPSFRDQWVPKIKFLNLFLSLVQQ